MMLTLSDCDSSCQDAADKLSTVEEGWCMEGQWPQGAQEIVGGLTTVRVTQDRGRFLMTAALSKEELGRIQVDMAPDALLIRTGRVNRWVPVPHDALLDEAVVQVSDNMLTVAIPVEDLKKVRHVVHVW